MIDENPLYTISNYGKILEYYTNNKDHNWQQWLSFESVFKPGKQGLVGLLSIKDNNVEKVVFKISQYINYLIQHENVIMNGINTLQRYCPHFCRSYGTITCEVDPKCRKEGNPFDKTSKYPIEKEVLLCEYIDDSCKFYNYIRAKENKISENILYSSIKQVLLAISIAQRKKQFTHYDLHSYNIMMRNCDPNAVFLYILDEKTQVAIPTLGCCPIIIDFGFSYINDMNDGPLWTSLAHTDVGFMSDRFDWVADPKLFLVTVSKEIKDKRGTKKSRKFRRMVRNMFSPLNIDWSSGWDEGEERGAADYVTEMVRKDNPGSVLFDDYEHYCIDIIQSLIVLPLEEQDYSNIHKTYTVFVKEFMKIEGQISSPFYNLYILKGIVDAARYVHAAYMNKSTRLDSIRTFRQKVQERVLKVANFCKLKNVHYEKMLCSLLIFAKCAEGIMYDVISEKMKEKYQEYDQLPLQSVDEIYGAIETTIPSEYTYKEDTTVFIFDAHNEKCDCMKLPHGCISDLNSIPTLSRGMYLYRLYRGISV